MSKARVKIWFHLAALLLAMTFASLGCGGASSKTTGCYVNGVYYPNGNAPNGQCVCPPIGPCTITFPIPAVIGATASVRQARTRTRLPNNQVLLTGGRDGSGTVLNTAELYDSVAQTSTALIARMTTARVGHTATRLLNGQVLLTGGRDGSGTVLNTAELYDPVAQTFTALTATMTTPRVGHKAALLLSGQVLLIDGQDSSGTVLNTAEVYDPMANASTPSPPR